MIVVSFVSHVIQIGLGNRHAEIYDGWIITHVDVVHGCTVVAGTDADDTTTADAPTDAGAAVGVVVAAVGVAAATVGIIVVVVAAAVVVVLAG